MSKQVADLLDKSIQRLTERGWCQGSFEDKDGRCCALGVMGRVDDFQSTAFTEAVRYVAMEIGDDMSIIGWNDNPGRTKEEVISLFQKVADEQRKKP